MSSDYLYGLIEYFDSSYRDNQQANFNSRGELSCSEEEIAIECSLLVSSRQYAMLKMIGIWAEDKTRTKCLFLGVIYRVDCKLPKPLGDTH